MAAQALPYQPGAILHDAVVGAFKARGLSFEAWCAENGVVPSAARNATYGQSKGPKGKALLARMIDAAGPEVVQAAYLARLKSHVSDLKSGAA
ncbi:MAG TPA: hypothetical protein PKY73_09190 [Hyphomonas sp.]|nr:hypothetical protein [Hyphomonas sp.]